MTIVKDVNIYDRITEGIAQLQAQRAELLAALKNLMAHVGTKSAWEQAQAAIDNAEGK